jgi:hypothetical protein
MLKGRLRKAVKVFASQSMCTGRLWDHALKL